MDAGDARAIVRGALLRYTQQLIKSLRFGGRFRCCLYFPKLSEAGSAVMEGSLD